MCENGTCGKYKPTFKSDWPWLLLIVMANETEIGYCFLTILRGKRLSGGVIHNLGMITCFPKLVSLMICVWMEFCVNLRTCSLVPLHKAFAWSIFKNLQSCPVDRLRRENGLIYLGTMFTFIDVVATKVNHFFKDPLNHGNF